MKKLSLLVLIPSLLVSGLSHSNEIDSCEKNDAQVALSSESAVENAPQKQDASYGSALYNFVANPVVIGTSLALAAFYLRFTSYKWVTQDIAYSTKTGSFEPSFDILDIKGTFRWLPTDKISTTELLSLYFFGPKK